MMLFIIKYFFIILPPHFAFLYPVHFDPYAFVTLKYPVPDASF